MNLELGFKRKLIQKVKKILICSKRMKKKQYESIDFLTKTAFCFFDLQKFQVFNAIITNILDSNFQSFFGIIFNLPSNLIGIRWEAIRENRILSTIYPKRILEENITNRIEEETLLASEIVMNGEYKIKYIPEAVGYSDSQKFISGYMEAESKKVNAMWFAITFLIERIGRGYIESKHSINHILGYYFLIGFYFVEFVKNYFSISFYFILFVMINLEFWGQKVYFGENIVCSIAGFIIFIYITTLILMFFTTVACKNKEGSYYFQLFSSILGYFNIFFIALILLIIVTILIKGEGLLFGKAVDYVYVPHSDNNTILIVQLSQLQVLALISIISYLMIIFLNPSKSILDLIFCLKDYLFYFPLYSHILIVYSFCHFEQLNSNPNIIFPRSDLEQKRISAKIKMVFLWFFSNSIFSFVMTIATLNNYIRAYYILVFSYFITILIFLKSFVAIYEHLKFYFYDRIRLSFRLKEKKDFYKSKSEEVAQYIYQLKGNLNAIDKTEVEFVEIAYEKNLEKIKFERIMMKSLAFLNSIRKSDNISPFVRNSPLKSIAERIENSNEEEQ